MTKNHSILEKFALKGYHHIVLEDGSFFINTHLYTSDGEERKIAEDQFRILREITSAKPGFIVGDLNIDEDRLSEVRGSFGYDISYGFTWSSLNPLTKLRFNKNAEGDRKLDYVLHNGAPLKSRCITRPLVSDHLPLITEFKENYLLEEIPTNI